MTLRSILFGGVTIEGLIANLGYAALRAYVGLAMAFNHGLQKLPPSENFISGVRDMGFPMPEVSAIAAAVAEFAGGLLLALGLLTRPAAFTILATMFVAGFIRHAGAPFGGGKELALTYAFCAVLFIALGSGKFAVDAFLRRRKEWIA